MTILRHLARIFWLLVWLLSYLCLRTCHLLFLLTSRPFVYLCTYATKMDVRIEAEEVIKILKKGRA